MMLSLAACNEDVKNISTSTIKVSNYIIPDDTDGEITVQNNCTYNLRYDNVSSKMSLATPSLDLPGMQSLSLTSEEFKFERYGVGSEVSVNFRNGRGRLSNGMVVNDITGFETNMVNYQTNSGDPFLNFTPNPMLVISYKIGGYTVRTFSPNAYYTGKTETYFTMPGSENPTTFETEKCVYRVNFADDMKTANVVLYNAQFANGMPTMQAIILKSLPVKLTREGYVITAENIVPEMMEGGSATPFPSKTFDKIVVTSSEDLTRIKCEYLVAGMFHGVFDGISCDCFHVLDK